MSSGPSTIKLLLIGASSVGKSSILLRYIDDNFLPPEEASATIGVDYKTKLVTRNNKTYKLSIWDTAGQERFRTLTSSYYRGCHGVFLVYGIEHVSCPVMTSIQIQPADHVSTRSERESFNSLHTWFDELATYTSNDVVKFVVGNKTDKESSRSVSSEEGRQLAQERGCQFWELSAKQGDLVDTLFDTMIDEIIASPTLLQAPKTQNKTQMAGTLPLTDVAQSSTGCAC